MEDDTETHRQRKILIGLIDDHELFRDGVAAALSRSPDVRVVVSVGTVAEFLDRRLPLRVVLLDVLLADGIAVKRNIRELVRGGYRVLVVSSQTAPATVAEAYSAGASGYLTKDRPMGELLDAVRQAAAGEDYLGRDLAFGLSRDPRPDRPQLTPLQAQALRLYAEGNTLAAVGRHMNIGAETVKDHLKKVRAKYRADGREATSQIELRRRAIEDGIMTADD